MESSRGYAYVKFATRNDAVDALETLYETRIGGILPKVIFFKTLTWHFLTRVLLFNW